MIALILGGSVYLFFRPHPLVMDVVPGVAELRQFLRLEGNSFLPQWLVDTLPDFMWAYALGIFAFGGNVSGGPILLPAAIGVVHEIGQGFQVFDGTFDPNDLLAYAVCALSHVMYRFSLSSSNSWNYGTQEV